MSYKMENRERKEIQLMRFIWVVRIKKKKKNVWCKYYMVVF